MLRRFEVLIQTGQVGPLIRSRGQTDAKSRSFLLRVNHVSCRVDEQHILVLMDFFISFEEPVLLLMHGAVCASVPCIRQVGFGEVKRLQLFKPHEPEPRCHVYDIAFEVLQPGDEQDLFVPILE